MTGPTDAALGEGHARVLARLREGAPRVQCLTNTVAQAITANCLHALGVRASMATHVAEVVDMTRSADAVLINLGTIDPARIDGIAMLMGDPQIAARPLVLDPVFVQHSRLRADLAGQIVRALRPIIKGNAAEIAVLRPLLTQQPAAVIVTTGRVDRIEVDGRVVAIIRGGHPYMAQVTGLGCALGAVMAACAAVEPDAATACATAVTVFGLAGARAADRCGGPGTFAAMFIDALADVSRGAQSPA